MILPLVKAAPVAAMLAFAAHGTDTTTIAVVFAALVYVVSVAKDIRPIKALRADILELRTENADLAKTAEEARAHAEKLAASRDFSVALAEVFSKYEERTADRADRILAAIASHDTDERKAWTEITGHLTVITHALIPRTEGAT